MPVVKHHEFTNKPKSPGGASPEFEPTSAQHKLDPRGHGRLLQTMNGAMDRPPELAAGNGLGLYVGLLVGAAIVLRVLLASLGPSAQPELALTETVEHHLALGESLIEGRGFALPAEHPAAPTTSLATLDAEKLAPRDLAQAHHAFETVRRLRGEVAVPPAGAAVPETRELPGVPALLGAYAFLGLPISGLILVQCLVGGLLVAPAYFAARHLTQLPVASLAAAVVVALHPGLITASLTLDGTVWAVALVVLGAASIAWLYSDRPWTPALGALGIGVATLIQPWAWLAAPALAWWRLSKQRDLAGVGLAALVLLVATAVPAAWVLRNHHVGAGPVLSSQARIDRAFGVPAQIAVLQPDGAFRNDPPAAIAEHWDAFIHRLEHPDTAEILGNPYGPAVAVKPASTVDTLAALRSHTWSAWFDEPVGLARYGLRHASQLFLAPSTEALLPHLGVPYERAGLLTNLIGRGGPYQSKDPITRWTTEAWIGLNALLLGAAILGLLLTIVRRQWGLVGLIGIAGVGLLLLTPTDAGESSRLPFMLLQGVAIAAIAIPSAPRRVRKPRAKVGDFTAAAPEGGFTIGLRPETVAALGKAGSHRAKGLMENLETLGYGKRDIAPHPYDALQQDQPDDTPNTLAAKPALAGFPHIDDEDDDEPVFRGRPI